MDAFENLAGVGQADRQEGVLLCCCISCITHYGRFLQHFFATSVLLKGLVSYLLPVSFPAVFLPVKFHTKRNKNIPPS